jgi:hypothetical protein
MRNLEILMERRFPMRIVLSIALLSCLLPVARGSNLSSIPCPANTLAYYQLNFAGSTTDAPDGPCAIGILNFSKFTFQSSGSPGADLLTADQIDLTPLGPPLGDTGDAGFGISGISVPAGQTATYVIDWFFDIDAGPSASGADLGMDPPFGDVTITQQYCVDSLLTAYAIGVSPTCYDPVQGAAPPVQSLTVTTDSPNASILFDPEAYVNADVRTIITLTGDTTGAGFDSVTGTSAIISNAAEPRTILLIPGGLLILFGLRRRALKQ